MQAWIQSEYQEEGQLLKNVYSLYNLNLSFIIIYHLSLSFIISKSYIRGVEVPRSSQIRPYKYDTDHGLYCELKSKNGDAQGMAVDQAVNKKRKVDNDKIHAYDAVRTGAKKYL